MLLKNNNDGDRWINVVDAPMGVGKTSAAIAHVNSLSRDDHVVFATPYVPECERIEKGCKSKRVYAIQEDEESKNKTANARKYLSAGQSIACTHELLLWFTSDMLENISSKDYTLVIDEAMQVVHTLKKKQLNQIYHLKTHGCITVDEETGAISYASDFERESSMSVTDADVIKLIDRGRIYLIDDMVYVWEYPIELLNSFKQIILLTYMFDAQLVNYYMRYNGYSINMLSARATQGSGYEFCSYDEGDGFRYDVRSKIHILENEKLNRIGDDTYALSVGWFNRSKQDNDGGIQQLGRNVRNVQKNVFKCSAKDFIWTSYKKNRKDLSDKNIASRYVRSNARAENTWSNCHYLAYTIGKFQNPTCINFFKARGYTIDVKKWALSEMIQWIWRSAIRNGDEIHMYIPSRRMRTMLYAWIDSVSGGGGDSE